MSRQRQRDFLKKSPQHAMIERATSNFAIANQSLGADKAYGSGEF